METLENPLKSSFIEFPFFHSYYFSLSYPFTIFDQKTCHCVAPTSPNHQATTKHPKEPPTTQRATHTNHYEPKSLQPPKKKIFFTLIIKPKFYLIT